MGFGILMDGTKNMLIFNTLRMISFEILFQIWFINIKRKKKLSAKFIEPKVNPIKIHLNFYFVFWQKRYFSLFFISLYSPKRKQFDFSQFPKKWNVESFTSYFVFFFVKNTQENFLKKIFCFPILDDVWSCTKGDLRRSY